MSKTATLVGLLEFIAKSLVDTPDQVSVTEIQGDRGTILELKVDADDMGKVIGKQGRIAKAIRTVINAQAMRENVKVTVEIVQ